MGRARDVARDLQPFGVLIEHGINDVDKRFVTGEQAMPPGEEIAFEPALAQMLAQHFHHPAVGAEIDVDGLYARHPFLAGDFVDGLQPIRGGFVGAKQAEIARSRLGFMTSRRN